MKCYAKVQKPIKQVSDNWMLRWTTLWMETTVWKYYDLEIWRITPDTVSKTN